MKVCIPTSYSLELAEETGLHIGDGSMNYYQGRGLYSLRGHKTDDRPFYIDYVSNLYQNVYGVRISLREWKDVFGFQITSSELVKFKNEELGLPLGKKTKIRIPEPFIENEKLAARCLKGIFDTDVNIYYENKYGRLYPRIEINTVSEILAGQIVSILKGFGFPSIGIWKVSYNHPTWNPIYRICTRGWDSFNVWKEVIGSSHPKYAVKLLLEAP
ncbi:MAG: hypothetical protein V1787_01615 [Candidatus Micrarchaeota archaeon]